MGIARCLISWCDNKFKEALHEEDRRKSDGKAFVSGAVEGFMDVAIIMYVPVLISCYIWTSKALKK